uniref:Uncharacterized protein n=1 Tax=Heterorhabditis bacteriophora TaxID=37862 RepID=A0A1I7WG11_HETBA
MDYKGTAVTSQPEEYGCKRIITGENMYISGQGNNCISSSEKYSPYLCQISFTCKIGLFYILLINQS